MKLMPALNAKRYALHAIKGFTLIELLVVISIIAILMAVATVSYTNAQEKGRDNRRKTDLKAVQQALEIYFNQNGEYPENEPSATGSKIMCGGGSTGVTWGNAFVCDSITYMNPLPTDPVSSTPTNYHYEPNATYSTYKIYAKIENTKDPDLQSVPSTCNSSPPTGYAVTGVLHYCVTNP